MVRWRILRHRARAAAVLVVLCGCSSSSTGTSAAGDEPPAPVAWKFETVSWYNRYSMNSTIGPIVVGRTVLYGGTCAYQNTKASKLDALDATTGMACWRMDYGAAFGPLVLQGAMIAVAAGDSVLGLDLGSGVQRWAVPIQPRSLTAAGDVVLVAERETIRAIDLASGTQRWQVKSTTDPVAAPDGTARWSLELPAALAYPQSLLGDHLYLLGAASLGSVGADGSGAGPWAWRSRKTARSSSARTT